MDTKDKISRTLRAVTPDGEEINLYLSIGVAFETPEGAWIAPLSIKPLEKEKDDMYGGDSWQATKIAMNHAASYLKHYIKKGGKLYFEDSDETEEPFTVEDIDEFF